MNILRTPDEFFVGLPDFPFAPHYADVAADDRRSLRMHYLDEGDPEAAPLLLLHGEPSWSFLYRKMIPPLVDAGHRVIAPDLIGFGRSDKPADQADHSYARHVAWAGRLLAQIDLRQITLFGQDWGGLIGLRLAAEQSDRFARLVLANTGLPTGDQPMPEAFLRWQQFSQTATNFDVGRVLANGVVNALPPDVAAAYDAPFPDDRYKAGPRVMPALVPTRPDDAASAAVRRAWQVLRGWRKPVLTLFSDSDPITRGADALFQRLIPGAAGQPHTTITGAGHFLQEDKGAEVADHIIAFLR